MSMCEQTSIMAYIRVSQTSTPALLHPRLCYAIARSIQISSISDTKNTQTSCKPINEASPCDMGQGGLYSAATNYALSELIDSVDSPTPEVPMSSKVSRR